MKMKNRKDPVSFPSFCIIAPTSYLDFTSYSQTHLTLAHLVDSDPEYAEFYKQRAAFGDWIVMDNSAYELHTPYSPDKLIELAHMCGAQAVVLPDYPFAPGERTISAAQDLIPRIKDAGLQTFFVPQSESGETADWIQSYEWAANNPDIDIIGMSILGMPNAIPWCDPAYARVVLTNMLINFGLFNFDKHHHYLGLNSGPALEIPSLIRMNALDTIDSSGPVWAGILGHAYSTEYDSYQAVKELKLPVDFNIQRSKDANTLNRVKNNILMTQDLMEPSTNQDWFAKE